MNQGPFESREATIAGMRTQAGTLQHGKVTDYDFLMVSQPDPNASDPTRTEAKFYLRLTIEPDVNSEIIVVYIDFEKEQSDYTPVRYAHKNGYATMPYTNYQGTIDMLRKKAATATEVEIFLTDTADGRNSFVLL